MVAPSKLARMDEKAKAFIAAHFANAPVLEAEMMELWSLYRDLGLPNDDFIAELTNGKRPSFAQRAWEMLLARHLHLEGHTLIPTNGGPDIKFHLDGKTVWVEAVAPEPKGLPANWINPSFAGVRSFPHEAILLRWTTALDAKWKKYGDYRKKGVDFRLAIKKSSCTRTERLSRSAAPLFKRARSAEKAAMLNARKLCR
jgi:hypothetical protein